MLRSTLLNIGIHWPLRSAYWPRWLAQVVILLDVGFEGRRLFCGGEHAAVGVRELDEVHLRRVARDVDQVVAREAVAVHVAAEHVAHLRREVLRRRASFPECRYRGRAEAEVRARVRRLHEHAMTLRVGGGRDTWIVRVARDLVVGDRREGRRPGIDGAVALAVAVGTADGESVVERLREASRQVPRRADALVSHHQRAGNDVGRRVVDPVRRPAWAVVDAGERRLRRRQIGVDIRDAVDVLAVEELASRRNTTRQPVVHAEVAAPDLRELEIRLGDVQLKAARALPRDVGRLVATRIRAERIDARIACRLDARDLSDQYASCCPADSRSTRRVAGPLNAPVPTRNCVRCWPPTSQFIATRGDHSILVSGISPVWYCTGFPS